MHPTPRTVKAVPRNTNLLIGALGALTGLRLFLQADPGSAPGAIALAASAAALVLLGGWTAFFHLPRADAAAQAGRAAEARRHRAGAALGCLALIAPIAGSLALGP